MVEAVGVGMAVEAVHAERPLHRDDGALDRLEQRHRDKRRDRQPDGEMDEHVELDRRLHGKDDRDQDVPDDDDRHIGREIVGALVRVVLVADGTFGDRFQELPEQAAFAAMRATADKAPLHRPPERSGAG